MPSAPRPHHSGLGSAAVLVGAGLTVGQAVIALAALRRVELDVLLLIVLGGVVVLLEQRIIHHNRRPLT